MKFFLVHLIMMETQSLQVVRIIHVLFGKIKKKKKINEL